VYVQKRSKLSTIIFRCTFPGANQWKCQPFIYDDVLHKNINTRITSFYSRLRFKSAWDLLLYTERSWPLFKYFVLKVIESSIHSIMEGSIMYYNVISAFSDEFIGVINVTGWEITVHGEHKNKYSPAVFINFLLILAFEHIRDIPNIYRTISALQTCHNL
jgi:hypothetical protein